MLLKRRTLLKCEREAAKPDDKIFYTLAVDVGRFNCNSAITVLKNIIGPEKIKKNLIYIEVFTGENFITQQAPRIKELIEKYTPREVIIDANGVGAGLMDAMVLPSFNAKTGQQFPPYYCFNNEQHLPPEMKVPSDEPKPAYNAIIYALKADAGGDKNDAMHANVFAQFSNGSVSLLADEGVVKNKLLSTKKGKSMDLYDRKNFLLPYEMTTRLIDEMANLRLKPTGVQNKIQVEQISRSTQKDRYSSLQYNLWRVKYYEDQLISRNKFKLGKTFAFFTAKNKR